MFAQEATKIKPLHLVTAMLNKTNKQTPPTKINKPPTSNNNKNRNQIKIPGLKNTSNLRTTGRVSMGLAYECFFPKHAAQSDRGN